MDPSGKLLWKYGGDVPTNGFHSMLPPPRTTPDVYALADSPRIIPPAKGAAYVGSTDAYSGYVRSDGTDIYLFTAFGDAQLLRTAFVKLTGRSPVSDIKTFGSWYSRYQNWTEADYKSVISGYKTNDFPLDVLVVDTTWRAGEDGTGYDINTGNFRRRQMDLAVCLRHCKRRCAHNEGEHAEQHAEGQNQTQDFLLHSSLL